MLEETLANEEQGRRGALLLWGERRAESILTQPGPARTPQPAKPALEGQRAAVRRASTRFTNRSNTPILTVIQRP